MTAQDQRSLGELFAELSRETSTLFRQEVALARVEMSRKATEVGIDLGMLVAGGAVAYAGFLTLLAALVLVLAEAIEAWAAALLVGLLVAAIGAVLVRQGLERMKRISAKPEQTMQTLKEDAEWLKNQAS